MIKLVLIPLVTVKNHWISSGKLVSFKFGEVDLIKLKPSKMIILMLFGMANSVTSTIGLASLRLSAFLPTSPWYEEYCVYDEFGNLNQVLSSEVGLFLVNQKTLVS